MRVPARPGPVTPGRPLRAALLLLVASLAALVGAPPAAGATRPASPGPSSVAGVGPAPVRHPGVREQGEALLRRAARTGPLAAGQAVGSSAAGWVGSSPGGAAVLAGVAVLVVAVFGPHRVGAVASATRGRHAGQVLGRAPPAYALA